MVMAGLDPAIPLRTGALCRMIGIAGPSPAMTAERLSWRPNRTRAEGGRVAPGTDYHAGFQFALRDPLVWSQRQHTTTISNTNTPMINTSVDPSPPSGEMPKSRSMKSMVCSYK
jgi:hypothetical protein